MNEFLLGAIILAAGSSSRLGRPKQLVRIEGEPLLKRVINAVREQDTMGPVAVVIGAYADEITDHTEMLDSSGSVLWVKNEEWDRGMGGSISTGMRFLMTNHPGMAGVLVTVCDQPRLDRTTITRLIRTFKGNVNCIAASAYRDALGTPVIFPGQDFGSLAGLSGSKGAKFLVNQHMDRVIAVDFPGGELDIDAPEDLGRASL